MQIRISFRSRSGLVLDADHALDFLSCLVLQACISFCGVSDKKGSASLFLPSSHQKAVAQMCSTGTPFSESSGASRAITQTKIQTTNDQVRKCTAELSCPLIGASFADRRSDREIGSGKGDRPSKTAARTMMGGGGLHQSASS